MANTSTPGDNVSATTVSPSTTEVPKTTTAGTAEATTTAEPSRPPMTEIAGVRFTGYQDVRVLTAADLGLDSLKGEATELRWSADNGKVVPKSELSAEAVDALIRLDGFEVVEA